MNAMPLRSFQESGAVSNTTQRMALICPHPAMEVCTQASGSPVEGGSEKASQGGGWWG